MKMFENNVTGGTIPIIETNNVFILKGQCYDKNTLEFEYLNSIESQKTYQSECCLRRKCTNISSLNGPICLGNTIGDSYVVDNEDPSITYVFANAFAPDNCGRVLKLKTSGKKTKLIYETKIKHSYAPSRSEIFFYLKEIIFQNKNNIYITVGGSTRSSSDVNYNNNSVYAINKETGECTIVMYNSLNSSTTSSACTISKIYEDNDAVILVRYASKLVNCTFYPPMPKGEASILKLSKIDNKLLEIGKLPAKITERGSLFSSSKGIEKDGVIHFYKANDMSNPYFYHVTIDKKDSFKVAYEVSAISFSNGLMSIPNNLAYNESEPTIELLLKNYDGVNYVHMIPMAPRPLVASQDMREMCTFRVNEDFSLTIVSKINPNDDTILGFVESINSDIIAVSTKYGIKIMKFDKTLEKFTIASSVDIEVNSYGIDSFNNLWFCDANGYYQKINIDTSSKITVDFKDISFNYNGTVIDSSIFVRSKDYLDRNSSVDVELIIDGEMTFEDGTKSKIIKTIDGMLEVPVKVIGTGIITVYPNVVL